MRKTVNRKPAQKRARKTVDAADRKVTFVIDGTKDPRRAVVFAPAF